MMLMLLGTAMPIMANEGGDSALGEQNGCGPNSTCGECVVQGTGSEDDGVDPAAATQDDGTVTGH